MRIGLTCTTIEPAIANGKLDGIGTYTKNLMESFIKQKQSITPISFSNSKNKPTSAFQNGQFFRFSYTVSTIASLVSPVPIPLHNKLKNHIDILHATDHMLPKVIDVPVIATICDAIMFNPANWHWDTIRLANVKKWVRKKTLHWADHYITISKSMIPELVNYIGIKEEKISVVYLGIHPSWFETISEEQKNATLKRLKLPKTFVLATGTIQHKKNFPRLINAYLQLPADIQDAYPLVIAGRAGWGTEESLGAIQTLTEKQKGCWLDYVSLDDLKVLFQCAALYAHPSLHEGFGLTMLEAFASKTPVLASNVTALPEIAGDAALLVDPYSVDAIRNGMQTVLTNKTLQSDLIAKGSMRAQEFTWEKCAKETLKIYKRFF